MRRAGTVVGMAQGVAVLRSPDETHAEFGATVVNERLESAGRIVDVFGPVKQPYLALTPATGVTGEELLGETLYIRTN